VHLQPPSKDVYFLCFISLLTEVVLIASMVNCLLTGTLDTAPLKTFPLAVHTCNLSYLGSRNQEDRCSKPARANSLQDPISKIPHPKQGRKTGASGRAPTPEALGLNSSTTTTTNNKITLLS
jgi:hypothetical protein